MLKRIARKGIEITSPLMYSAYFRKHGSWNGKRAAFTLSFDVDYPSDVKALPKLLEVLDCYQMPASFACVGKWVEHFPRQHQQILEKNHEIINHTYSHPNNDLLNPKKFNSLSERQQEDEVAFFEEISSDILGVKPSGFRAPHFGELNCQSVYGILEKRGYKYSSSTALTSTSSGGAPYRPSRKDFRQPDPDGYELVELPVFTCPEHYFSVFDTYHAYHTGAHVKPGDFSRLFFKMLNLGLKYGAHVNTYFDPRDVAENKEFESSLRLLKGYDYWIAKCGEVADYFIAGGCRQ
ncbi:polysaccharide deacetylase family protein [Candidatus Micrarchaeota archaeon]|nr:polysaccharide deacetylase family protein [Candidatus Micrarchaeota archaeon]